MNVLAYLEVHRFLYKEGMSNVWSVANVLRSVGYAPVAEEPADKDLGRHFTLALRYTLPGRRYIYSLDLGT